MISAAILMLASPLKTPGLRRLSSGSTESSANSKRSSNHPYPHANLEQVVSFLFNHRQALFSKSQFSFGALAKVHSPRPLVFAGSNQYDKLVNPLIITIIIALATFIISIFGASWLNQQAMNKRIDDLRSYLDARFDAVDARFDAV